MHSLHGEDPEYSFLHTSLLMTVLTFGTRFPGKHGFRGNKVSGAERYHK
jgi:hypothetical protein